MFSQCEMYDVDEVTVMALLMNASDTLIKIYDDDGNGNKNKLGGGESENESGQTITTGKTTQTTTFLYYPKIPCKYGWNYDLTTYKSTIVTEVIK